MGMTFGNTQLCWRCKGSGKVGGLVCAVCGGGKVLGEGEMPVDERKEVGKAAGVQARNELLPLVQAKEAKWSEKALQWITSRVQGSEFTADDLTLTIGEPAKRAAVGSAFAQASRRGLIQRVGLDQSSKPTSHASVIMVWRRV